MAPVAMEWVPGCYQAAEREKSRYGFRMPELSYLVRVAERDPGEVVNIILEVPISSGDFNPAVVDGFMRICSQLPGEQLKRVVRKIYDDGWVRLMAVFGDAGLEYGKMVQTLAHTRDFESILILAEAILTVRSRDDDSTIFRPHRSDNPFYFESLSYSKIFEYLRQVEADYAEKALALLTESLNGSYYLKWSRW